jgi:hypothetical protein
VRRALLACWLLLGACDNPLIAPQRIERLRVLGARVEAQGDPSRAWPRPGETAHMTWLVADPTPAPPLGWAFRACVAEPLDRGMPKCEGPPFYEARSAGMSSTLPAFDVPVPQASAFGAADRLIVQGAVCEDAEPLLAEPLEQTSCAGELALMEVRVELDEQTNTNPAITADALSFDGAAWVETAPPAEDCSVPGATTARAGSGKHRIVMALSPSDRDALPSLLGPPLETLLVSHFATAGSLARAVSVIEAGSADLSVALDWDSPGSAPATGTLVRFYFVVRDLRGGVDWSVRRLCVFP